MKLSNLMLWVWLCTLPSLIQSNLSLRFYLFTICYFCSRFSHVWSFLLRNSSHHSIAIHVSSTTCIVLFLTQSIRNLLGSCVFLDECQRRLYSCLSNLYLSHQNLPGIAWSLYSLCSINCVLVCFLGNIFLVWMREWGDKYWLKIRQNLLNSAFYITDYPLDLYLHRIAWKRKKSEFEYFVKAESFQLFLSVSSFFIFQM